MRTLIAIFKFIVFAVVSIITVPPQMLVLCFHKGAYSYVLPRLWHSVICLNFRIRVTTQGRPYTASQVLYMSNHISYLDIPMLSSRLPPASFVAKKDVASWPVFGFLAKLQQTAFISRARSDAQKEAGTLDHMLREKKNLVLFPEGTSTDGRSVIEFKSSLFSVAYQPGLEDLKVQPVTIQILRVDGRAPDDQDTRDLYAWHRDMDTDLATHLWRFAKHTGAEIQVTFHDVLSVRDYSDRKTLAKACHEAVSKGLDENIHSKLIEAA